MTGSTRPVSVVDVARAAHVSLGTVSNALNHPERVSPATLRRVQEAIAELGFVRNEAARQLRAGRSRSIGLIVLDVSNPFFTDISQGVEEAATAAGLSVLLCNSAESADREAHYVGVLEEQRVFGILVAPVTEHSVQMDDARARGLPIVLVDWGSSAGRQCSVSVDDVTGGHLAIRHLLELGHRKIAVIGGPLSLRQVSDRLAGARAAFAEFGDQTAPLDSRDLVFLETETLNVINGRRAGQRLLELEQRPTAAFCVNDLLALGVLQAMTTSGLRVPDDLAIVGYDDIDFASAAAVPLTSVRQPRSQLGRAATRLLIDEVDNAETHHHQQVVFAPELVVRQSTVSPAKPTPVKGHRRKTAARRSA